MADDGALLSACQAKAESTAKLAEAVGVNRITIYRWIRAQRIPKARDRMLLERYLDGGHPMTCQTCGGLRWTICCMNELHCGREPIPCPDCAGSPPDLGRDATEPGASRSSKNRPLAASRSPRAPSPEDT